MKTTSKQRAAQARFKRAVSAAKKDKSGAKWQTKVKRAYKKL